MLTIGDRGVGCQASGIMTAFVGKFRVHGLLPNFLSVTSLSKLSLREAILGYGGATLVGGATSFAVVCAMWLAGVV